MAEYTASALRENSSTCQTWPGFLRIKINNNTWAPSNVSTPLTHTETDHCKDRNSCVPYAVVPACGRCDESYHAGNRCKMKTSTLCQWDMYTIAATNTFVQNYAQTQNLCQQSVQLQCVSKTCIPLLLPTHLYKDFAQTQNLCQQSFWLQCVSKTCTPLLLSTSLHWDFEQTINPCQQSFCYNVPVISHIYTIAATRKSAPWLHKRLKPKPTQFSATLCQ